MDDNAGSKKQLCHFWYIKEGAISLNTAAMALLTKNQTFSIYQLVYLVCTRHCTFVHQIEGLVLDTAVRSGIEIVLNKKGTHSS